MKKILNKWNAIGLVKRIIGGLAAGTVLGLFLPQAKVLTLFGELFVGALKAVAPVLVLFLVMGALSKHREGKRTNVSRIVLLYLFGAFLAGLTAVVASFLFPLTLTLTEEVTGVTPPGGIGEVVKTLMGLVFTTISEQGIASLFSYGKLVGLLAGCMAFVAFVVNPLIVFAAIRKNPFPLVLKCLKDSGITAFFTRSSAANIPVNMKLCEELGLDEDTYAVSIPLGATINMGGAAVTISVLALAAAHTVGVQVDLGMAVVLGVLSAVSACGASGVAGGSLLLVPMACSLFGIPNDIAMQVVGVGFIVGVIQDSCETALNSSTDVLYTAVAELWQRRREMTVL